MKLAEPWSSRRPPLPAQCRHRVQSLRRTGKICPSQPRRRRGFDPSGASVFSISSGSATRWLGDVCWAACTCIQLQSVMCDGTGTDHERKKNLTAVGDGALLASARDLPFSAGSAPRCLFSDKSSSCGRQSVAGRLPDATGLLKESM